MQVAAMEDDYVVPVDDAGIAEPLFHGGPVMLEDPIPAMPFQEIPPQVAEANANDNKVDLADFLAAPEDQPEDLPIIIIASNDDEEDVKKEIEDVKDDPEEILFDDDDWDVFSDVTTE
ncbi:hypothetical protein TIFTF001_044661 [Ficus carica]|uniref:Uncharacterized protein n=1 Tax=Ficus carica TaxID=3494 RepID=A0AA87ZU32_FICCA|nr:hypothetical protein TIFTF001_044661 [Ficus carica]